MRSVSFIYHLTYINLHIPDSGHPSLKVNSQLPLTHSWTAMMPKHRCPFANCEYETALADVEDALATVLISVQLTCTHTTLVAATGGSSALTFSQTGTTN